MYGSNEVRHLRRKYNNIQTPTDIKFDEKYHEISPFHWEKKIPIWIFQQRIMPFLFALNEFHWKVIISQCIYATTFLANFDFTMQKISGYFTLSFAVCIHISTEKQWQPTIFICCLLHIKMLWNQCTKIKWKSLRVKCDTGHRFMVDKSSELVVVLFASSSSLMENVKIVHIFLCQIPTERKWMVSLGICVSNGSLTSKDGTTTNK